MQTGGEILGRQEEIHSRGFDLTSPQSGFMTRTEYLDKYGKDLNNGSECAETPPPITISLFAFFIFLDLHFISQ